MITDSQKQMLELQISDLQNQLTGDFMSDLEIKAEIHTREMMLNGVEPASGDNEDCLFCGS